MNKTGPVHLSLKLFKHSHNFYQQPFVTVGPLCTCVQNLFHFALHFQNPEPSRAKTSLGRHPRRSKSTLTVQQVLQQHRSLLASCRPHTHRHSWSAENCQLQKHATALPTPLLATTDCTRTARSCGARVLALAPSSSSARELVEHSEHSARLVAARSLCRLNGLEPPPGHGVVAWLCPRRQSQSSGFGGR